MVYLSSSRHNYIFLLRIDATDVRELFDLNFYFGWCRAAMGGWLLNWIVHVPSLHNWQMLLPWVSISNADGATLRCGGDFKNCYNHVPSLQIGGWCHHWSQFLSWMVPCCERGVALEVGWKWWKNGWRRTPFIHPSISPALMSCPWKLVDAAAVSLNLYHRWYHAAMGDDFKSWIGGGQKMDGGGIHPSIHPSISPTPMSRPHKLADDVAVASGAALQWGWRLWFNWVGLREIRNGGIDLCQIPHTN